MAIGKSGSFDLSGTLGFSARVTWEEDYSIEQNTSTVNVWLAIKSEWYAGVYYINGPVSVDNYNIVSMSSSSGTHCINTNNATGTFKDIVASNGQSVLPWISNTIIHDDEGRKSVVISINISGHSTSGSAGSGFTIKGSQTIELTTIPRASTFVLSATSVDVGGSIIANITRASENFTHIVEFYINDVYYQKYTDVAIAQTYTIPESWYYAMPSSTSCTAYCRITTYNGTLQIGDQVRQSFTVVVPSDIIPTIGAITLNPDDINGYDILVKGKNQLVLNVDNCSAGFGSTILSYTFSGPSISKTISSASASASVSIPAVSTSGTLTYNVIVTDTRGRTASKTNTIICYDYYAPYFSSFNAYRANADGTANANGTYLKCVYVPEYASVNSTNSVVITVVYNDRTTTDMLIDLNGDVDTTYKVYLIIEDEYGGRSTSDVSIVFGQTRIFNITQDGTGVAIGKIAESGNLFECRWDAKFDGTASGPSGFSTSSDERIKKNIQDITIDIVDNLRPIQYELIHTTDKKVHYGFIAQEVDKLLSDAGLNPELTGIIGHIINNGRQEYVLTYTEFIPLLTKKCQDLQRETNILKQEIAELKNMVRQMSS